MPARKSEFQCDCIDQENELKQVRQEHHYKRRSIPAKPIDLVPT